MIGTIAHLFMTWSLRFAPSATVAPVQYVEIPFAAFVGWVVFQDFPNGLALAGIVVTVAAGLYILLRERPPVAQPCNACTATASAERGRITSIPGLSNVSGHGPRCLV